VLLENNSGEAAVTAEIAKEEAKEKAELSGTDPFRERYLKLVERSPIVPTPMISM